MKEVQQSLLSSSHLEGGMLVESRLAMLDKLPKGMRAVELGVAAGGYSREILNRCAPAHLTLVDLWQGGRYSPAYDGVLQKFSERSPKA